MDTSFTLTPRSKLLAFVMLLCFFTFLPVVAQAAFTSTETIFGSISNTTQTWDDAAIGTADADRKVIVFIIINENGNSHGADGAPSGVTIGGISATKVADNSFENSGGNNQSVTVWTAAVPTGTTADIVASGIPAANYNGGIAVLTTTDDIDISTVHDSALLQQDGDGGDLSLDVPANGLAAGAGVTWPDFSGHTWSGLTEVDEVTDGGDNYWSVATYSTVGAQTPLSASVSYSASVSNFLTVSFAVPDITSNLIGHWTFDEGSGSDAFDSAGSNDGVFQSTPTWTAGQLDGALDFDSDGSGGDQVTVPEGNLDISGSATFAFWLNLQSTGGVDWKFILAKRDGNSGPDAYSVEILDNKLALWWTHTGNNFVGYETDAGMVPDDTWAHWVVVRDAGASDVRIYKNGVEVNSTNAGGTFGTADTTTSDLTIGGAGYEEWHELDGILDDVRIYDRALTYADVAALYAYTGEPLVALSRPPNNLGLVGYWSFNDGTGTIATDFSGNGNTGTLINSPSWIAGKRGTALDFDNSTNYLDFTDSPTPALSGAMSTCAWVKPRTIADGGDTDIIVAYLTVSGTSPYYMALDLGGELQFAWTDDSVAYEFWETNDDAVVTNIWQHVCAVRTDGDSVLLYVDGVAHPTNNTNDEPVTTTTSGRLAIGAAGGFDLYYFDGGIDDVRVYNRALGAPEIAALARASAARLGASSVDLQQGSSIADGLVGHWTMDGKDTLTTITDRSVEGNNGYFIGGATSSAKTIGALGQALAFDGASTYVDMGNDSSLQVDFPYSIAAWVKTPNFNTYNTILTTDHVAAGAWLQLENSTGRVFAGFGNWHGRLSAGSLTTNTWHHVVGVVRGADDIDVYLDGTLSNGSYDGGASTVPYGSDTARMGDDSLGNSFYPGSLDDVRIYNRELTATEAKQLYNLGQVKISQ